MKILKKLVWTSKIASNDVLNSCNLLIKVNCPSDNEIKDIKEKTIINWNVKC